MKFVVGLLAGTGKLMGKTAHVASTAVVWTISGTARVLTRPFSN